jgi:undecaprenyl-diphosphatase
VIRFGRGLLSPFGLSGTTFAVRLGPVLAGWIAALATIAAARRLGGESAAVKAAVVITVLPLAAAGLILATPDAPLLAAIALAVYCVVRVLETPVRSPDSLRWWIATGVALGLAFWSKYTSIFFPLAVLVAVAAHPGLRARFAEPGPYVACVVATLVFSPVLIWNSQHDWISFTYQIAHGLEVPSGSALRRAWRQEGDFFGGQAALASPILFIMFAIVVGRSLSRRVDPTRFVLAVVALVSFGFFVYSATRRRVEPNWPAPAYIAAIVLLATTTWGAKGKRWFNAGVVLAAVMSALIYVQGVVPILPVRPDKDPIGRAHGWRDVSLRADSIASALSVETNARTWLGGDRYQEASELAFHAGSRPTTFSMNLAGRVNQYMLWPQFADVARPGENLLLLVDDDDGGIHSSVRTLTPQFNEVRRSELVELKRGAGVIGTRRIWLLIGWRGPSR